MQPEPVNNAPGVIVEVDPAVSGPDWLRYAAAAALVNHDEFFHVFLISIDNKVSLSIEERI